MNHVGHFKKVCKFCGTLIGQCRCMSLDKTVIYETCNKCKDNSIAPPKLILCGNDPQYCSCGNIHNQAELDDALKKYEKYP